MCSCLIRLATNCQPSKVFQTRSNLAVSHFVSASSRCCRAENTLTLSRGQIAGCNVGECPRRGSVVLLVCPLSFKAKKKVVHSVWDFKRRRQEIWSSGFEKNQLQKVLKMYKQLHNFKQVIVVFKSLHLSKSQISCKRFKTLMLSSLFSEFWLVHS